MFKLGGGQMFHIVVPTYVVLIQMDYCKQISILKKIVQTTILESIPIITLEDLICGTNK